MLTLIQGVGGNPFLGHAWTPAESIRNMYGSRLLVRDATHA